MLTVSYALAQPLGISISAFTNINCNSACDGTASSFTTGGSAPYTYSWVDLSIPDTISGENSDSIAGLCAGNFAVVVIDASGTIDSAFFSLNEPAIFTSTVSGQSNVSCFGLCDGTATVTTSGGTAPNTYLWLDASLNPLIPSQTDSTATNLCSEAYTIQIEDANGCSSISIATITEPPLLNLVLDSVMPSSCTSCNGIASVSASGGTTPYTFAWNDANSQSTSLADSLCISTYSANVIDASGCVTTLEAIVTDPSGFFSSIDQSISPICSGACDGQAEIAGNGGNVPYTYAWIDLSIPDTIIGATDSIISGLCTGNYVGIVINNDTCISTTANILITEPPTFTATITDSVSVSCFGDSDGTLNVNIVNGVTPYDYSWSSGNTTTGSSSPSNIDSGLAAGVYFITVTDSNGCITIDSTIILTPQVLLGFIVNSGDVLCAGTCTGNGTVSQTGGTAPFTYLWDSGTNPNDSANTGLCAGTQSVTITDNNGCMSISLVTISEPAILALSMTSNTMISCNGLCDGNAMVTATGGITPLSYSWTNGDTSTFTDSLCPGTHTVTVVDSNNCSEQISILITEPLPLITNIVGGSAVCEPLCNATETAVSSGGATPYTYLWSNGDTDSFADSLCSGLVSLTVNDSNGCSTGDSSIILSDTVVPTSNAGPDIELCLGATASLGTNGASPLGGYTWQPSADLSCTNCQNPEVTPATSITYQAIATNIACTDTDEVVITIIACIIDPIPEVITPNQDGTNDIFEIPNIDFFPENTVSIFNEWGDLVFYTAQYHNTNNYWEGNSSTGMRLPDGTYFYVLTLGDDSDSKTGFVMIYR